MGDRARGTTAHGRRCAAVAILRCKYVISAVPRPERLVHVMAKLCEREGLEPCEAAGIVAEALTWPPDRPRDPEVLLRQYREPS